MIRKISAKSAFAATALAACAVVAPARAQDADAPAAALEAAAADGLPSVPQEVKPFTALVRCARAKGVVLVLKPGASDWAAAEEGRYYPLGTSFRTAPEQDQPASAEFAFGPMSYVRLTGAAEVATKAIAIGDPARTVVLKSGRVMVNVPRTLKEGLFFVAAPYFTCSNLAGESLFDYKPLGDGDETVVRCVTGSLALEGRHYKMPRMVAANQVRIRSTGDDLYSWLRGERGDSKVFLDQGLMTEKNFETGEEKDVQKTYEFSLSPRCAIKIFRRRSPVGGNMLVSMMATDAAGVIKTRCAFAEGRSNVNSGELVIAPVETTNAEKEKAKAASEETEEVEAVEVKPAKAPAKKEVAEEEPPKEEEKKDDEKKENKSDDDDI